MTKWKPNGANRWINEAGDTIHLVNPRGRKLYARVNEGNVRPVWYDSLREARRGRPDQGSPVYY